MLILQKFGYFKHIIQDISSEVIFYELFKEDGLDLIGLDLF